MPAGPDAGGQSLRGRVEAAARRSAPPSSSAYLVRGRLPQEIKTAPRKNLADYLKAARDAGPCGEARETPTRRGPPSGSSLDARHARPSGGTVPDEPASPPTIRSSEFRALARSLDALPEGRAWASWRSAGRAGSGPRRGQAGAAPAGEGPGVRRRSRGRSMRRGRRLRRGHRPAQAMRREPGRPAAALAAPDQLRRTPGRSRTMTDKFMPKLTVKREQNARSSAELERKVDEFVARPKAPRPAAGDGADRSPRRPASRVRLPPRQPRPTAARPCPGGSSRSPGPDRPQAVRGRQRPAGTGRGHRPTRDNPLTARVMVNRIWAHHFGQGLVRTPSDFGVRSDPPTRTRNCSTSLGWPVRRIDGWSVKALHRLHLAVRTGLPIAAERTPAARRGRGISF